MPSWQPNADLGPLNTMACPSVAEYLVAVENESELAEHINSAQQQGMPWHILGGGSNILCPPRVQGLVIRPLIRGISAQAQGHCVYVTVGAGENWHALVAWCLAQGYYGLENLALIPGNAGAAPIQNIGAYGVEVGERLHAVRWYDAHERCFKCFSPEQCLLDYRDSIFKQALKSRAVITHITLRLSRVAAPCIHYAPLAQYFATLPASAVTPQAVFDAVCELRQSKLPDPKTLPNCGSFYKNPIIARQALGHLQQSFVHIPFYDYDPLRVKIPAAWLIDQAGLKGQNLQGLRVHDQQALVLTNPHGSDLLQVLAASDVIVKAVQAKFGIAIEREPQVLGVA